MQDIAHSEHNFEQVYLVGVRLFADSPQPDFYTMVLYNEVARGDANRPLTQDGRIVFAKDTARAGDSLVVGDPAFRKYLPFDGDVSYVYDVPAVLDAVSNADHDEAGVIADFINELFDFVASTPFALPTIYKDALSALADRTTFDKHFGDLFQASPTTRSVTRDGLLWAVGAIIVSCLVFE